MMTLLVFLVRLSPVRFYHWDDCVRSVRRCLPAELSEQRSDVELARRTGMLRAEAVKSSPD